MTLRWVLVLLGLVCALPADAANLFVRQGGAGTNSGVDWSNACNGFTGNCAYSSLGGDTAYLADGSYSTGTVAPSNVVIKKCSPSDGVSAVTAGYSSTFCDGQAVFPGGWNLDPGHGFTVDGSYRNESNWGDGDAYGIKHDGVTSNRLTNSSGICADNVTIRYTNVGLIEGTSESTASHNEAIYLGGFGGGSTACENWLIQRSYIHNYTEFTMIQCAGCEGMIVEYVLFKNGWGKEAIRGQVSGNDTTIRHSRFENSCGFSPCEGCGCTGEIAMWGAGDGWNNIQIYGCTFFRDNGDGNSGGTIVLGGDGVNWLDGPATNARVFNNTIAGVGAGEADARILINGGSGNVARNNLWYDVNNGSTGGAGLTASNNFTAGADPFVSYSTGNLRLTGATTAGSSTSSPAGNAVDMDGVTRGGDGTWDVGAFEYSAGGPVAPTELRVIGLH